LERGSVPRPRAIWKKIQESRESQKMGKPREHLAVSLRCSKTCQMSTKMDLSRMCKTKEIVRT